MDWSPVSALFGDRPCDTKAKIRNRTFVWIISGLCVCAPSVALRSAIFWSVVQILGQVEGHDPCIRCQSEWSLHSVYILQIASCVRINFGEVALFCSRLSSLGFSPLLQLSELKPSLVQFFLSAFERYFEGNSLIKLGIFCVLHSWVKVHGVWKVTGTLLIKESHSCNWTKGQCTSSEEIINL